MGNHQLAPITSLDEIDVSPFIGVDDELLNAIRYLIMRDKNMTHQQIVETFGLAHRNSIYTLIARWNKTNALERAREIMLIPKEEEIRAAHSQVISQWPDIVKGIVQVAMFDRSGHTRLEAAAWLFDKVVQPGLMEKVEKGSNESAYAQRLDQANPSVISIPKKILKRLNNPSGI